MQFVLYEIPISYRLYLDLQICYLHNTLINICLSRPNVLDLCICAILRNLMTLIFAFEYFMRISNFQASFFVMDVTFVKLFFLLNHSYLMLELMPE